MNENINDFSDVLEQKRHFDRDIVIHPEPTYICASCGEEKTEDEFLMACPSTGLCQCIKCEEARRDRIAEILNEYSPSLPQEFYTRMDQLRLKLLERRSYFERYYLAKEVLEERRRLQA